MFFGIFKLRALTSKQSAKGARSTLRESFIGNCQEVNLVLYKIKLMISGIFSGISDGICPTRHVV